MSRRTPGGTVGGEPYVAVDGGPGGGSAGDEGGDQVLGGAR